MATDCEKSHGRDITWTLRAKPAPESIRAERIGTSWIVEVVAEGTSEGKPFHATHLLLTSPRTTPEALLQLARDRWSLEGWHWIVTPSSRKSPTGTAATALVRWPLCGKLR